MHRAQKHKVVFFGTSEFAVPSLSRLAASGLFEIAAVVTQPDKPAGRKQKPLPSPVKREAEAMDIPVLQPAELTPGLFHRRGKESDLFVVVAYGKIIPQSILVLPRFGTINVHPSLLPRYRGPSPIQTALLHGDEKTGVTVMLIDEKMDHGPILVQSPGCTIEMEDTYVTLSQRLAETGADLLINGAAGYLAEIIKPQPQDHTKATYTKLIKKEDGQIEWTRIAQEIYNQWRAFIPWPGVYTLFEKKRIKIIRCKVSELPDGSIKPGGLPGTFLAASSRLFAVCGKQTALEILEIQPEGKKILTAGEFIAGYLAKMLH